MAHQDVVTTFAHVPLSTPTSAIGSLIVPVLEPLYRAFDGFVLPPKVIEDMAAELVERRLQ